MTLSELIGATILVTDSLLRKIKVHRKLSKPLLQPTEQT